MIGFSPFGVDQSGWNILGDEKWTAHSRNYALIGPMDREIAQWQSEGKLKTAVEEPGTATQEVDFGPWQATVAFGFPQQDGRRAPGTKDAHGAALVAQLGPDEFLVTGVDASVIFHLPNKPAWIHSQILTAEQLAERWQVAKAQVVLSDDFEGPVFGAAPGGPWDTLGMLAGTNVALQRQPLAAHSGITGMRLVDPDTGSGTDNIIWLEKNAQGGTTQCTEGRIGPLTIPSVGVEAFF